MEIQLLGKSSLGQTSFGQTPFGQISFGQTSSGQTSSGQLYFGQTSFGQLYFDKKRLLYNSSSTAQFNGERGVRAFNVTKNRNAFRAVPPYSSQLWPINEIGHSRSWSITPLTAFCGDLC